VEVGVTLHHPHGQIYAYPFVPPLAAAELHQQREYLAAHGVRPDLIRAEGRGEAEPIASNDSPETRANNRRVEIIVEPAR
jgi:UDPglucose--hexose-1-phosphate uridylyltransferase